MSNNVLTLAWRADVPLADKLVLVSLADQASDQGYCFPRVSLIAQRCGMEPRSVFRVLQRLEADGHLERITRRGHSSAYLVHPVATLPEIVLARGKKTPDGRSYLPLTHSQGTPDPRSYPPLTHGQGTPDPGSPITIIEPSFESHTSRAREPAADQSTPEAILAEYPPTPNGNRSAALHLIGALIDSGEATAEELLQGTRRFRAFVDGGGRSDPTKVQGPEKFFVRTRPNDPAPWSKAWEPPPAKIDEQAAQRQRTTEASWQRVQTHAQAVGCPLTPHEHESPDVFETHVKLWERSAASGAVKRVPIAELVAAKRVPA